MSNSNERWWERVPRMFFGWGLASLTTWKFFALGEAAELVARASYILLIAFFAGMAHSTVTGIVLGSLGRAWSFVRRAGYERREISPPLAGTNLKLPAVDRRKKRK